MKQRVALPAPAVPETQGLFLAVNVKLWLVAASRTYKLRDILSVVTDTVAVRLVSQVFACTNYSLVSYYCLSRQPRCSVRSGDGVKPRVLSKLP